jgi:hypothetical protein
MGTEKAGRAGDDGGGLFGFRTYLVFNSHSSNKVAVFWAFDFKSQSQVPAKAFQFGKAGGLREVVFKPSMLKKKLEKTT